MLAKSFKYDYSVDSYGCQVARTSGTLIGYQPIFQMLPKTSICITGILLNRTLDVLGRNLGYN